MTVQIHAQRILAGRCFDFSREVAVMAIVNRTPDSFYDKGKTFALDRAVAAARAAILDGAIGSTSGAFRSRAAPK